VKRYDPDFVSISFWFAGTIVVLEAEEMMRTSDAQSWAALIGVLVLGLAVLAPQSSFGAAAQLLGTKKKVHTKERVVKTDRALHEIQAAFDPVVTGSPEDLAIQSFDLSVLYDTSLATVNSITLVPPFAAPPGDPGPVFDSTGIHNIRGETPFVATGGTGALNTDTSNEDLFDIDFDLKPGVPDDTPLTFELIADDPGNFIMAIDPTLPDPTVAGETDFTGPDEIDDSFLTASDEVGQIAAGDVAAVPLPAGVWQGCVGGLLLTAYLRFRRGGATAPR
jgi:hypothetical protein